MQAIKELRKPCQKVNLFLWQIKADKMARLRKEIAIFAASKKTRMQNAAQAIAIASSPFVFNNDIIAIPAIIYALMMNIILLGYVGIVKRR